MNANNSEESLDVGRNTLHRAISLRQRGLLVLTDRVRKISRFNTMSRPQSPRPGQYLKYSVLLLLLLLL